MPIHRCVGGVVVLALLALGQAAWAQDAGRPDLGTAGPPTSKPGAAVRPASDAPPDADREPNLAGETIADPIPIPALPFATAGNSCGFADDYDAVCDWAGAAPDVVYLYTPATGMQLDIDLCGSGYDTKVFVLDAALEVLACNDDYYRQGDPCGGYVSRLRGAPVSGGTPVYIVVDGFGPACGDYVLTVSEHVPCELSCPGGRPEGEPTLHDNYTDRFNAGCNSPGTVPIYQNLQADQYGVVNFCGVSGFYTGGGLDHRDTDWFTITLGPTGEVVWQLDAEQTTVGYVLELSCPNPGAYGVVVGGPCEPGGLTIVGTPGASVALWVGPPVYVPPLGMIGKEYDYHFVLTGLSPHQAVAVESVSWGDVKSRYR